MERRLRICEHCGSEFPVASTGRPPRYCKSTCRKNAWHQAKVDDAVKAAQQKAEEATAAAIARAVLAERRRSNRGNETRQATDIRGNETPSQAMPPIPAPVPVAPPTPPPAAPAPTPHVDSPPRPRSHFAGWVATEARAFVVGAMSGQQGALFDEDQEQPDA